MSKTFQAISRGHRPMRVVFSVLAGLLLCSVAPAADWPTWRCDPARSGATEENLPEKLERLWSVRLPKFPLAWPNEPRLQFDTSYEPVVLGKTLFVGSPLNGSVTAYDTESGRMKWQFYTEGPVRFAPVAWKKSLFVASDDGRVYSLDAATGGINWVFRAVPEDRPDLRLLGNNRLVSYWPVRGGPVLAKGKLFFASGLWPAQGVFVYALDPESGKVVWKNEKLALITHVLLDHQKFHDTGLSPQGYLVFSGGKLLVPNGRSMPAALDPETGRLLYYRQGYRFGHCRVTANDKYVFVGEATVLDLATGLDMGSIRFHPDKAKLPKKFTHFIGLGAYYPYKFTAACDAWSVLAGDVAYGIRNGTFYAYDLRHVKMTTYERTYQKQKLYPSRWDPKELWRFPTKYAKRKWPGRILIRAGNRLYGNTRHVLLGVELPAKGGKPRRVWKARASSPTSMIAADGKLFVVTESGQLICYGAKKGSVQRHERRAAPLTKADDEWGRKAADILKATGATEGYCLVLGLKTGRLVEEILNRSKLKVIAVDADRARVDALREKLTAADLYAGRAEAFVGDPRKFRFPPYIASLVVSETLTAGRLAAGMKSAALFEVLRPYGGVACLDAAAGESAFKAWVAGGDLQRAEVSRSGEFLLLRRVGALPGSAPWTHETADASRTYFSRDKHVKPPLVILWFGDGPGYGFYKYRGYGISVKPQVAGGRLFAFQIFSRTLQAMDVYTGRNLWQAKVESFTRYASMEDGIYVAEGNSCVVYDPATGRELRRFRYSAGGSPERKLYVSDIRVGDRVIVVAADFSKVRSIERGLWDSAVLIGIDRKSGKQLWTFKAAERVTNNALAMGDGAVFCIDSMSKTKGDELRRRGDPPKTSDFTIIALDESTGKVRWRVRKSIPFFVPSYWVPIRAWDDRLAYSRECKVLIAGKHKTVYGLDPETGKEIWTGSVKAPQPMILAGTVFYDQLGYSYDIRTGKPVGEKKLFQRGGCNYGVGGEELFFLRDVSATYVEAKTGKKHHLFSARSGCSASLIPADGVLSVPNFSVGCICNYPIQTAFAMVHMPEAREWEQTVPTRMSQSTP